MMANSPARAVVDVGSVIADTYKIEALLGRGGMGAVFLASHNRLAGKRVAIKILHTELEDVDIVARFKREAEIAARLNHPNIVGVIDYNVAPDGMPYLVLDYLEGETLAQRIAGGPMPLDQVLSIVRQVGSALAAAHRAGIVHRDLKPQNIFLVQTEVDGRIVEIAKVLDFGISKIRGSQTVKTQDSALLGTPQYMAPEQATGQHANVDERTDVFAFGAIVYEMLCGQPAFAGASIPEVVFKVVYEQPVPLAQQAPSVPSAIVTAVARAMAKPSDDRFATVSGFVEALTGQPLTLPRGQPPGPTAMAESPSAARRVATGEAFAQTMGPGSGDHGESPVNPLLATAAPPTARERGLASSPAQVAAPAIGTAPGVALLPPRRRSAGLIAAIAAAAVAAGGVFVVMRRESPASEPAPGTRPDHPPDQRVATPQPPAAPGGPKADAPRPAATATEPRPADVDPKPADPRPANPAPTDPKHGVTAAPTGKPVPKPDKPHGKPDPKRGAHDATPPQAEPADDGDGDDDVRQKLKQATAALDRHDYDVAERLANAVINSPAGPKQRAAARLIHGTVQCVARNDQEAAGIDLRYLERFRVLRGRLLNVCRSHGILTTP